MTTSVFRYAVEGLAHAGFAILHAPIALTLRPDLWTDGLTCVGELAQRRVRERLLNLPGVLKIEVAVDGVDGPVTALTRSTVRLEERVAEITGFRVCIVPPGAQPVLSQWAARRVSSTVADAADAESIDAAPASALAGSNS